MDKDNALKSIENNTKEPISSAGPTSETSEQTEVKTPVNSQEETSSVKKITVSEVQEDTPEEVLDEVSEEVETVSAETPEKPATVTAPPRETSDFSSAYDIDSAPFVKPQKKKSKALPVFLVIFLILIALCGAAYYFLVVNPSANPFKEYFSLPNTSKINNK